MREHALVDIESARKPASNSLIGLHVIPVNPCECGTKEAVIDVGSGPHPISLRCAACAMHRGWLGRRTLNFLDTIVRNIGRPAAPIILRRAVGWIQSFDLKIRSLDEA